MSVKPGQRIVERTNSGQDMTRAYHIVPYVASSSLFAAAMIHMLEDMTATASRAHPMIVSGTYRLLHGGDYNPEQWQHRPEILDEDPRLMRLAGVNEASVGIFAWAAIEPERDRFEFGWLDGVMDRLHAAGVGVILATPLAARPRWLAEAHPEVMRTRAAGQREVPGFGRHNPCCSSPVLRERGALIIDKLAARYATHPALVGWHIDNEFGGAEDSARCFCDRCQAGFRTWLQQRYRGDLGALNRAWWTAFWSHQYQSWDHIRPGDNAIEASQLNWRRWCSELVADYCRFQIAAVRRHSQAPVTTNYHGGLDHYDHGLMAQALDYTSFDSYPGMDGNANDRRELENHGWLLDATRGFKPGRPWLLMESCPSVPQWRPQQRLKRPGVHRALSLAAVAQGSDGVCYFQWRGGRGGMEKLHGAVINQDAPHDTRVFREVAGLGRDLTALSGVAGADTPASVAVLWDVESEWARRLNSGLSTVARPGDLSHAWHRATWAFGANVDIVDATTDLAGYRIVVVPGVFLLRPGFVERLRAAARAGAQVLIDGLSAWVDEDMACVAGGRPGPLRSDLGLRCEEFDQLRSDESVPLVDAAGWLPAGAVAVGWVDRIHADGCEVLVSCRDGFHAGWPLLTRKALGAGAMWYLAGDLDDAARLHLLRRLAAVAAVVPCLPGLTGQVVVRERVQPDRRFVFLINPSDAAVEVPLEAGWSDAVSGDGLDQLVRLAGWDARILVRPT
jgi:beta-galactosidase